MNKPEIINVIEMIDNSITSIESFIITNETEKQNKVDKAEKLFADKAKENGVGESSIEDLVEDGYFSSDNYSLFLTWSDVK